MDSKRTWQRIKDRINISVENGVFYYELRENDNYLFSFEYAHERSTI
jgi:hypothetical protein